MKYLKRIFVCVTIISVASYNIFAQLDKSFTEPREYTIAELKVEGIEFLQPLPILKTTGLKVGQKIKIPGPEISHVITKLWKQDLFSDVKVYASKIEGDEVYLTIYLKERARLNSLTFTGVKKGEEQDLRDVINFNLHMQVNENKKNIARKKIEDYFH